MSLPEYPNVSKELQAYVQTDILPQYEAFDAAHRRDHAEKVIADSMAIAAHYPETVPDIVYAAAACHDLGLCCGREHHHEISARLIRADRQLRQWFSTEEIAVIAEAAEDHRASAQHAPRTLYGRIIAEADRQLDPETTVCRAVQYGRAHAAQLNREEQFERVCRHLQEKYGEGGYLQLWIPESPNAQRLAELRQLIQDRTALRHCFDRCYEAEEQKVRHR